MTIKGCSISACGCRSRWFTASAGKGTVKKILNILLVVLGIASSTRLAAQVNVKTLSGMNPAEIKAQFGTPVFEDPALDFPDAYRIEYKDFALSFHPETFDMFNFETISPKFYFFDRYIANGIRVGDQLSRIQTLRFEATPYGKNKERNALRKIDSNDLPYIIGGYYAANYVIFSEESKSVYLNIENGVIKAFAISTKLDVPTSSATNNPSFW